MSDLHFWGLGFALIVWEVTVISEGNQCSFLPASTLECSRLCLWPFCIQSFSVRITPSHD